MKKLKLTILALTLTLVTCSTKTAWWGNDTDNKNTNQTYNTTNTTDNKENKGFFAGLFSNDNNDATKYTDNNDMSKANYQTKKDATYKAYDNTLTSTEPDFRTKRAWDYTTRTYDEKFGDKPMTERNQVRNATNYPMQDTTMTQNRAMD